MYHHLLKVQKYQFICEDNAMDRHTMFSCFLVHRSRYMKQLLVDIEVDICVHR